MTRFLKRARDFFAKLTAKQPVEETATTAKILSEEWIYFEGLHGIQPELPAEMFEEKVDFIQPQDVGRTIWVTIHRDGTVTRGVKW